MELKTKDDFLDTVILHFSDTPTAIDIFREIQKMRTYQIKDSAIETFHTVGRNVNINNSVKIDQNKITLSKHKNKTDNEETYQNDFQLTYSLQNDIETIHKVSTTINKEVKNRKTIEKEENSNSYCYMEKGKFVGSAKEKEEVITINGKTTKRKDEFAEIALPTAERLNIANRNGTYTYMLKRMDQFGRVSSIPISQKLADILIELKDDAYAIINNEEYYNLKQKHNSSL